MANTLILMAEPRTVLGKQVKALRRAGLVPAVVYGPAVEQTVQVSVNRRELERFYHTHGHATLFTLKWEGGSEQVFIKEVQVEPVRRAPLHVDFFAPNLKKDIVSGVPVLLHNLNSNAEGVLMHSLDEVQVRGLPAELPHQIDADIAHLLHPHDALRAGDLTLPKGVTLVTDPETVLASLVAEVLETQDQPAEAEAVAEKVPAAGEAAETGSSES